MLWLAVVLPDLPLDVFLQRPTPFGVIENHVLVACDEQARTYGLLPGLTMAQAYSLCPALIVKERDRSAEEALLENLAVFSYSLSSRIVVRPEGILARFTDKVSPLGDPYAVLLKVEEWFKGMRSRFEASMAPTSWAAWLCARSGLRCVWTAQEPWRLSMRPLSFYELPLSKDVKNACLVLGFTCVGDLLDLPRSGFLRRFGKDAVCVLERLMGERPDVEDFWEAPLRFRRRLIFSFPVETEDALLFAVNRIAHEWGAVLQARRARVSRFTLDIVYQDRSLQSEAFTLVRPEREAGILLGLVRERLRGFKPSAPIAEVSVLAPFEPSAEQSLTFWADSEWSEQEFQVFLDRLHARLGAGSVHRLSLCTDHRPERATMECGWISRPLDRGSYPVSRHRPLWLVDPPLLLDVIHDVPSLAGPLQIVAGPERLETGWWDDPVVRDYFVAMNASYEHLWVFRSSEGEWFLQGYFC